MASTGNTFPTTAASVDRAGATAWTNPGNVVSDNTTDATALVPTDYLVTSGYGFNIPANATIRGVTVRVEASETGTGSSNYIPQLHSDTTPTLIGSAKGAVTVTGTTKVISTTGGVADTWGASLTPAIVNAAGFGVSIWSTDATNTLAIDFVTIAIEYSLPTDDGDVSWWGGTQMCMVGVPIAIAAAALATSVAIAGNFHHPVDEVPSWLPGEASDTVAGNQRAQHTTAFQRWAFVEDLPSAPPAFVEDDPWRAPLVLVAKPAPQPWAETDEIVTAAPAVGSELTAAGNQRAQHTTAFQRWAFVEDLPTAAAPSIVEGDSWQAPYVLLTNPATRHQVHLPAPWFDVDALPIALAEDTWQAPVLAVKPIAALPWATDDLPVAAVPLPVDELYPWSAPVVVSFVLPPQPWATTDEIVTAAPATGAELTAAGNQRAQHTTAFQRWYTADDLPLAATPLPVDIDALPIVVFADDVKVIALWGSDDAAPVVQLDEFYWQAPTPLAPFVARQPLASTDDIVTAPTPLPFDEEPWAAPFSIPQRLQISGPAWHQDERVNPSTPLPFDEEPWARPFSIAQRLQIAGPNWHQDERPTPATPLAVDDDYQPIVIFAGEVKVVALWGGDGGEPVVVLDDVYPWTAPITVATRARALGWTDDDLPIAAAPPAALDASEWQPPFVARAPAPAKPHAWSYLGLDDDGSAPQIPGTYEDDQWTKPFSIAQRIEVSGPLWDDPAPGIFYGPRIRDIVFALAAREAQFALTQREVEFALAQRSIDFDLG